MSEFIYQGATKISEDDFKSHLGSLCQLENIGVLLGAGASVGCGGMTMKDVWLDAITTDPNIIIELLDFKLITQENIMNNDVNVEQLLDQVTQYLSVFKNTSPLNDDSDLETHPVTRLQKTLLCLYQSVTKAALLVEQNNFGNENLGSQEQFKYHRELLEKLISNRQPGQAAPMLFTTNYDLSLEWAAEEIGIQLVNGFSGLHTRTFQPQNFDLSFRNVNAKGEARFGHYHAYLHKLHGSLSWIQEQESDIKEIPSALAKSRYIDPLLEGEAIYDKQFLIYPGANKYHHTIGFVYGEMFRRFSEFLSKPQTAIFVNGYGFGDYHINRIILGALLNPSLHIVIFYPELDTILSDTANLNEAQKCIKKLRSLSLNQITIVGGYDKAYFNSFVKYLPKPVLFPRDTSTQDLVAAINDLVQSENQI
ncbi:SIR2 family anti-phage-associated protein [Agarivorans sp. 1_MG-2023]|uniref:SIR2 family anti-phage-associated protein n=1 Tax=Agarivorans sp. 1_MG-2023 TaxID=3062634 RepID=UPI0026E2BC25|nr:SIR2 family anti-phage-associated protein [Agarivorans sp. 1_MG-2023]MDO6762966.1 SIR2 family protein [Agarivorans sp. 1_MG-2023]